MINKENYAVSDVIDKHFIRIYYREKIEYYINAIMRRLIKKELFGIKCSKEILSDEEGNLILSELIKSGEPFAAGRYGGTEAKTITDVLYNISGSRKKPIHEKTVKRIMNLSGFFPDNASLLIPFTKMYLDASQNMDLIGVWNIMLQGYLVDNYAADARLADLCMFEPYYFSCPWSKELAGKKVVVVHPFAETIATQYQKREFLFENKDILPEFELRTITAVQTLAGVKDERFSTWFEALDYMYTETMKEDFDVALIGCGAYGFPLAAKIKQAGKQAIHIGGALQILFGIKGSRWDNDEIIGKMYNEYWVRPAESEKISNAQIVEESCYW